MLQAYAIREARLSALDPTAGLGEAVWFDLLNPTQDEEATVEQLLGIEVPTREEMAEIEISSRLYSEDDGLYMTAMVIVGGDTPDPKSFPITFILARERLVTVRYSEPGAFKTFTRLSHKSEVSLKDADGVFIALLEAIIDRTADLLEKVSAETDAISHTVFQNEVAGKAASGDYKALLRKLGRGNDLNSKVRESLVSIGRLVNFLSAECAEMHPKLREHTEAIAADVRSLTDHASYLASTSVFLLDATLGLINIEQNTIIKIVSLVAVLIMPPTLVASVYGMNFDHMPELHWRLGYPLALAAMLAAAVLPYWYFKRRGWL